MPTSCSSTPKWSRSDGDPRVHRRSRTLHEIWRQISIGLNDASPDGLDVGTLTGLSDFTEKPDACFPSDYLDPHTSNFQLHQAFIKPGKKGRAEANFWFHGATTNGMVRVIYVLKLFGEFEMNKVWPGAQTLEMDTWELKVENEGKTVKDISCQGAGTNSVTITIE